MAESAPDRVTIETAISLLAGLAPPTRSQVWSSYNALANKWQPIAVNSVEFDRAWKLSVSMPCKTAELVENFTITQVPGLKHFLSANHDIIKRIEVLTGEDFTNDLPWYFLGILYDTYQIEKDYFGPNFRPPRWADPKTLAFLRQVFEMTYSIWGADHFYLKLCGNP